MYALTTYIQGQMTICQQFVYNLVTFFIQFVLDLSCLCMEFVTTNTTRIFVICRNLDKKKIEDQPNGLLFA